LFGLGFYAIQLVRGNLGRLRACGGIVVFALSFGAVWGGVIGVLLPLFIGVKEGWKRAIQRYENQIVFIEAGLSKIV
jgi:hypothetical protein